MTMTDLDSSMLFKVAQRLSTGAHGGFMAHIGEAYLLADTNNKDKLLEAFGDTFDDVYRDIRRGERIMARLSGK